MELVVSLAIVLYAVDAALLAVLAFVYGRTTLHTRATYPLALFIFSMLLLVQSAGTAVGCYSDAQYLSDPSYAFIPLMGLFELAGIAALLKITL
jgi:hypothetical protein